MPGVVLSAWCGLPDENQQPSIQYNWIHVLCMIRELRVKHGRIYQQPITEHMELRGKKIELRSRIVAKQKMISLNTINCFELILKFEKIIDKVCISLNIADKSFLSFDFSSQHKLFRMNRHLNNGRTETRDCFLTASSKLALQIFFDRSIIEVFINHGEEVMTTRVFPTQKESQILIQSEQGCLITQLVKYDY